jgi:branched-chain amino acid transport system ATP-binding protein
LFFKAANISIHYGGVAAVDRAAFAVQEGEMVTLIGANGAGKTSVLLAISGLVPISNGEIWFLDNRIDKMKAHEIARLGITQVPEGKRLFANLSVDENLEMGGYMRMNRGEVNKAKKGIWDIFPILYERRKQRAKTLSGGQQQMVAIGRALMGMPKLMLLDEPSLGLSPLLVQELAKVLALINREQGISVILVEQNANVALRLAQRGYVMEVGKIILEGKTDDLLQNKSVKEAYLGG